MKGKIKENSHLKECCTKIETAHGATSKVFYKESWLGEQIHFLVLDGCELVCLSNPHAPTYGCAAV